jgi:hypothetical protein
MRFKSLALLLLLFISSLAYGQEPNCFYSVAQSIGQGIIIPMPGASIRICTPGSSQAACASGNLVPQTLYTTESLATVQPNPLTADAGGNFYFCSTPAMHFAMYVFSASGGYFTPDLNTSSVYNHRYDIRAYGAISSPSIDNTAAFQNAVNAAAAVGDEVYVPVGIWPLNGTINPACDAIICVPAIQPTSAAGQVKITGVARNRQDAQGPNSTSGSLITTTTVGTDAASAIIGAPFVNTGLGNNQDVYISNITFRTYPNPAIGCVNMYNVAGASLTHLRCEVGENYSSTSHTKPLNVATGFTLPKTGNDTLSRLTWSQVTGYYQGVNASEHAYFEGTWVAFGIQGMAIEPGYNPIYGKIGFEEIGTPISVIGPAQVDLEVAIELDPTNFFNCSSWCYSTTDIYDANYQLYGLVKYYKSSANIGNITTPIAVNSGGRPVPAATYYNLYTSSQSQLRAPIFTSTGTMPTCTVPTGITCTIATGSTEARGYITFVTTASFTAQQMGKIYFGTPLIAAPFVQLEQTGNATWYGIAAGGDTTTTYFDVNNTNTIPSGTTLVVSYVNIQ